MAPLNTNPVAALVQTGSGLVDPASYNVQAIGQAKGLMELGWSVDYYANFQGISEPTVLHKTHKCTLRAIPVKSIRFFREIVYFPGLAKLTTRTNYRFLQVGGDSQLMTPLLLKAVKRAGIPTVFVQGMYRPYKGYKRWFQEAFDFFFKDTIIHNVDYVFAKTPMARNYLQKKGYSDIKFFPVGLDIPEPKVNTDLSNLVADFKARFESTLLYIGKIESRRNPEFLLRVLAGLKETGLSVGLLIVGQGPQDAKLKLWIDEMGLSDSVLHMKNIGNSETHIFYEAADVFLLPTNYEIYGMVVMEALYWGCPVIAAPEAGPSAILTKPEYGICVDLTVHKWVEMIQQILKSEDLGQRVQRSEYIQSNYSWVELGKIFLQNIEVAKTEMSSSKHLMKQQADSI